VDRPEELKALGLKEMISILVMGPSGPWMLMHKQDSREVPRALGVSDHFLAYNFD